MQGPQQHGFINLINDRTVIRPTLLSIEVQSTHYQRCMIELMEAMGFLKTQIKH